MYQFEYPYPLAQVVRMLSDVDYRRIRVPEDVRKSVSEDGTTFITQVSVNPDQLPDSVPALARKFLPSTVDARIVEQFSNDFTRCEVTTDLGSLPAKFKATLTLSDAGDHTDVHADVDLQVTVPFVGRKITDTALSRVDQAWEYELDCARKYWCERESEN